MAPHAFGNIENPQIRDNENDFVRTESNRLPRVSSACVRYRNSTVRDSCRRSCCKARNLVLIRSERIVCSGRSTRSRRPLEGRAASTRNVYKYISRLHWRVVAGPFRRTLFERRLNLHAGAVFERVRWNLINRRTLSSLNTCFFVRSLKRNFYLRTFTNLNGQRTLFEPYARQIHVGRQRTCR